MMTDPVENAASLIRRMSGDICRKAYDRSNSKDSAAPCLQRRCTPETPKLIGLNSNIC
jgi:hypothetical protein